MAETAWAVFPPVLTIVLALATKEVYMSLLIGIFSGAKSREKCQYSRVPCRFRDTGCGDYPFGGDGGVWRMGEPPH